MKKLGLLLCFFGIIQAAIAQNLSAVEIISKSLDFLGGKNALESINTLQYHQQIKLNFQGNAFDLPIQYTIERDKLYRLQFSVFGATSYVLINDDKGYQLYPANPFTGASAELKTLSAEEFKKFATLRNPSGFFTELLLASSDTVNLSLAKEEKINGKPCYTIKHKQEKNTTTYYINKSDFSIVRTVGKGGAITTAFGALMGSRSDRLEITLDILKYENINGFNVPVEQLLKTPAGDNPLTISGVLINEQIDKRWYKADGAQ